MKRIAVVMLCVVALLFSAGTAFAGGELFLYNWSDYTAPDLADQILAASDGGPMDRIIEVEFGKNAATNTAVIAEGGEVTPPVLGHGFRVFLPSPVQVFEERRVGQIH